MKLLFITGSRGEWGYIRPILRLCQERSDIDFKLCVTNMHLLPSFGSSTEEIIDDGFKIDHTIYMSLDGYNHYSMVKSLGIFLCSLADIVASEQPDWIILAGDRGEQLMGSLAGAYTYIPVAHIQAGERSGNIDGTTRHAIDKFTHLHFSANNDAAERLIKLGEEPSRVHNVGAPQLDEIREGLITEGKEISWKYGIDNTSPYLLVVMHPVTEEMNLAEKQIITLIQALKNLKIPKVWILPNNDAGAETIRRLLLQKRGIDIKIFKNLTRRDYLAILKHCSAIVGNSSSGLLEAPTFRVPAVNLGRWQQDRVQGKNVINAPFELEPCTRAINRAVSKEFRATLKDLQNPYGDGRSSERILNILLNTPINDRLLIKKLTY